MFSSVLTLTAHGWHVDGRDDRMDDDAVDRARPAEAAAMKAMGSDFVKEHEMLRAIMSVEEAPSVRDHLPSPFTSVVSGMRPSYARHMMDATVDVTRSLTRQTSPEVTTICMRASSISRLIGSRTACASS